MMNRIQKNRTQIIKIINKNINKIKIKLPINKTLNKKLFNNKKFHKN